MALRFHKVSSCKGVSASPSHTADFCWWHGWKSPFHSFWNKRSILLSVQYNWHLNQTHRSQAWPPVCMLETKPHRTLLQEKNLCESPVTNWPLPHVGQNKRPRQKSKIHALGILTPACLRALDGYFLHLKVNWKVHAIRTVLQLVINHHSFQWKHITNLF